MRTGSPLVVRGFEGSCGSSVPLGISGVGLGLVIDGAYGQASVARRHRRVREQLLRRRRVGVEQCEAFGSRQRLLKTPVREKTRMSSSKRFRLSGD